MAIQPILVLFDFSLNAEHALDVAVRLAQPFQARLTLMHVIYMPVAPEVNLSTYFAAIEADAQHGIGSRETQTQTAA